MENIQGAGAMTLKVIGAGFGRTGTLSLKTALEQIGFGPCYHMVEVLKNPAAPAYWEAAADREAVDWAKVFEGYGATVDWPSATFYRELADAYPDAKVILTERDAEAWFASTQATIFSRPFDGDDPFRRMARKVIGDLFPRGLNDKDSVIEVYRRHNATVRQVIPPERLLVYELSQGWGPLCAFLGVDPPATDMPRVNSTEDFLKEMPARLAAAGRAPA
jgi:hypothetical protein